MALGLNSIALAPFAVLAYPVAPPSVRALLALAGLGVLCTAVAMVAYISLIAEAGPSRASFVSHLNPAVVVVLGDALTPVIVARGFAVMTGGPHRYAGTASG